MNHRLSSSNVRMSDDVHRWKVTKLPNGYQVPSIREVDAASPIAAVEAAFEKQIWHVVPPPVCDYLGGDIWMVTVSGARYLAIAPFTPY